MNCNKDTDVVSVDVSNINTDIFKVDEIRFKLDATKLRLVRKHFALKQQTFAHLCGWSRQYQQRLENGKVVTVSEATANVLSAVIDDLESAVQSR